MHLDDKAVSYKYAKCYLLTEQHFENVSWLKSYMYLITWGQWIFQSGYLILTRQDKTRQDNLITFLHVTVMTHLALQVAEANRGRPGTIKINEFC